MFKLKAEKINEFREPLPSPIVNEKQTFQKTKSPQVTKRRRSKKKEVHHTITQEAQTRQSIFLTNEYKAENETNFAIQSNQLKNNSSGELTSQQQIYECAHCMYVNKRHFDNLMKDLYRFLIIG